MVAVILTAAFLGLLWLAVLALLGHHREAVARAKAEAALRETRSDLERVLSLAACGALRVERQGDVYQIAKVTRCDASLTRPELPTTETR